jgi:heme oxygenase
VHRSGYLVGITAVLGLFWGTAHSVCQQQEPERRPLPTLAKTHDAHSLGASVHNIDAIQRCHRPPTFASGGLSGYTYAVLGSTLGARIIVRQLRAVLGPAASFRFDGGEDGLYQAAWSAFRSDLEESGENDLEPICATAVGIFDACAEWFLEPIPGLEARW